MNFNLSLDVQSLHQEIKQLTTIRDLLQLRRQIQPQSPTGSLSRIVGEYYRLFRRGYRVQNRTRRRHVITATEQSEFLRSVVDEEIDFGNQLRSVDVMIEQIRRYSLLMRFIRMQMERSDAVTLDEDNVLIKTTGTLRFQILRETMVGMFPHVMANEDLLSRLIGAEVECPIAVFNHRGIHQQVAERYITDVYNISVLGHTWSNTVNLFAFLEQFVSPCVIVGHSTGRTALEQFASTLRSIVDVLHYRQCSEPHEFVRGDAVTVCVATAYEFCLHEATVRHVFPHLLVYAPFVSALVGAEITCPSLLELHWESKDAFQLVTRIVERLDWDAALTPLFLRWEDRDFVMHQARLSHHGHILPASDYIPLPDTTNHPQFMNADL